MEKNEILSLIYEKYGGYETLKKLLVPCVNFKLCSQPVNNLNYSKIGSNPNFFNEPWPHFYDKPLTFLGQISLNEINEMNSVLPKTGMLFFFIDTNDIKDRFPDQKGEFKVIYVENPRELIDSEYTFTKQTEINELFINFYESYSFAMYNEGITSEEIELIDDIKNEIRYSVDDYTDIIHQVLGYPDAMQAPLQICWPLKYSGTEHEEQLSGDVYRKIMEEGEDFILLLQLDFSDPKIEFDYFGDSMAYFGIHKKDLQSGNFENVVLIMQNT